MANVEKASLFQTYNQAVENVEKNYGQVSWISILDKPTLILMPEATVPYDMTCGDETATYLSHALPNISSLLHLLLFDILPLFDCLYKPLHMVDLFQQLIFGQFRDPLK